MSRTAIIGAVILILASSFLSGCGLKSALFHREPPPVKSEVVREADWEMDFNDVYFVDAKNGWIIGEAGTIIHTSDGGKNWEAQDSGTDVDLNKIQFTDEKNGWIVGNKGYLLHTIDAGRNWRKQVITDGRLTGLHFPDRYRGWIAWSGRHPLLYC